MSTSMITKQHIRSKVASGNSILGELLHEVQKGINKIDSARQLFQSLINRPDANRQNIIKQFEQQIGVTNSTAVSYYERLAKEAGITKDGDKQELGLGNGAGGYSTSFNSSNSSQDQPNGEEIVDDELENDERVGIIRTIANAHLIYKERSETGTYNELWIYNIGKGNDELDIKRDVLAGTDIPPTKTKSPDGSQSYTITTMGNAQYLHVMGLPQ